MDVCMKKRKIFAYLVYKYFIKGNGRKYWMHLFIYDRLLKGAFTTRFMELKDEKKFFNYFRMSIKSFDELATKLSDKIKGTDTAMRLAMRLAMPPIEILAVTLRTFINGKTRHRKLNVWEGFQNVQNFPNCLGAIDSKHVRIVKPEMSGSLYYSYKKYFFVVLFGIVDSNYMYNYVDIGAAGKESDSYIFERSKFYKEMMNNDLYIPRNQPLPGAESPNMPFVFIGDEAFVLLHKIIRPYSGNMLKRIFNYRLTRARRFVECAFGILSNKWRVRHKPINVKLSFAVDIIKCCILQNFVRSRDSYEFQDVLTINGLYVIENFTASRQGGLTVNQIRNDFAEYFVSDNRKVPWEDQYI